MGCAVGFRPSLAPPPCDLLASGAEDRTVRVWHAERGDCLGVFEGHSDAVCAVAALGGGVIATGSRDGTLRLWCAQTGECVRTLEGHKDWVVAVAALGGGLLASGSRDSTLRIWRAETGECLYTLTGHSSGVLAVAGLGGDLVSGARDYTLRIWRIETGRCLRTLEGHRDAVRAVVALGGGLLASGSEDNTVRIWRAETGAYAGECLRTLEGHRGVVFCVAAMSAGLVASGSGDNTIRVWSYETGACLRSLEGHRDWVLAIASLDGQLVSGSKDCTIRVWCAETGVSERILRGHSDWIFAVAAVGSSLLVDWDANAERQAAALLANTRLDLIEAGKLLQGRPRHGAFAELESRALEQAYSLIDTCLVHLAEVDFEAEAAEFEAARPELQLRTGSNTSRGQDWGESLPSGPLGKALAPIVFLTSLRSDGDPCLAVSPDTWAQMRAAVRARLTWATQRGEIRCLRYAVLLTKHLHWMLRCMDTQAFDEACAALHVAAGLPDGWRISAMVRENHDDRLVARVEVGNSTPIWKGMQSLLNASFVKRYTRDRRGAELPQCLQLRRLFHVQNEVLWRSYQMRQQEIREALKDRDLSREPSLCDAKTSSAASCFPQLEEKVHERWLWHGTTHASVEAITREHFKLALAGSRAGTLYGKGIYLCECCSKSDEYTEEDASGDRVLLLCRTTLGRIFCTAEDRPDRHKLTEFMCQGGAYHAVLGDRERTRGTYREIILYDTDQVYPEYMVFYRRVMRE